MALEKQNQGNLNLATYSEPGTHQQTPHVSSSSILAAADTYEKTLTEPRAQKQSTLNSPEEPMKDWMPPHWPWYVEGASHLESIEMIGNTALLQMWCTKTSHP